MSAPSLPAGRCSDDAHARFWRSIAEAEGRDEASVTAPLLAPFSRRNFLTLAAASLALAGAGCSRPPLEKIVPYRDGPAEATYGKPVFYASGLACGGDASGVLVECNMGRPTKIEGHPDHPASLGATDVLMQAAVLELWDPDRSQLVRERGRASAWGAAARALQERVRQLAARGRGAGLAILTETVSSPSLLAELQRVLDALPGATWHTWQPFHRDAVHAGTRMAFGAPLDPVYHFDRARVVVALDADFLGSMPGHVRYAFDFSATRRADAGADARSRLYAIESAPTLTGANADHRLPVRAGDVAEAAQALAQALGVAGAGATSPQLSRAWLDALVQDLRDAGPRALVVPGEGQPAEVHRLAHAINQRLGAVGGTMTLIEPIAPRQLDHAGSLRDLATRMRAGDVDTLLILGANPAYTAPAELDFAAALRAVPFTVHHGLYLEETAAQCTWHLPAAHALESWGDVRSFEGTVTLQQPCIAPLYDGRTAHQVLAAVRGDATAAARTLVFDHWRASLGSDEAIDDALRRGVVPGDAGRSVQPAAGGGMNAAKAGSAAQGGNASNGGNAANGGTVATGASSSSARDTPEPVGAAGSAAQKTQAIELVFVPDPRVHDGRYANNPWLQELPKPLSQLVWDNAAEMSPALAARLGVTNEDVVEIAVGGRTTTAPVWVMPGMPDGSIALALGYGRTRAGSVGTGRGFDAYPLRVAGAGFVTAGVTVRRTGQRRALACAQDHGRMEGRDIVRVRTAAEAAACTSSRCGAPDTRRERTLYDSPPLGPYAWAMSIDLSACIGCGTCTIACQAENNIPTVGKEEVRNGREMHWIRVDRYYQGDVANPRSVFQPVPCMQCEHAPCEVVCPVEASVHDAQGINVQVYNRCVGTRFCQNNCPYKVRRFNFFQYTDDVPQHAAQRNPEVTARMRGVMEKCTYCLQRITTAKIEADREGRRIRDGEVVTACQAACPTRAIVFGDLNDPASAVNVRKASPLDYTLLAELNTRPRTTYLVRVVNPSAGLQAAAPRTTS